MSPLTSSVSSSAEASDSRVHGSRAPSLCPLTSHTIDDLASPRGQSFFESLATTGPSDDEENALVNTFQTHMISYFPFVVLGGMTPTILRTQRPFLLATIVLGASRQKVTRQKPAARRLLQSFTERCLLDGRISLDLLQAILVYIQWYVLASITRSVSATFSRNLKLSRFFRCNCHFINNPQISILIQLAVSLVVELGLNKKPRPRLSRHQQLVADASTQSCEDPTACLCHSLEEMRAFLGCFHLSSMYILHSNQYSDQTDIRDLVSPLALREWMQ